MQVSGTFESIDCGVYFNISATSFRMEVWAAHIWSSSSCLQSNSRTPYVHLMLLLHNQQSLRSSLKWNEKRLSTPSWPVDCATSRWRERCLLLTKCYLRDLWSAICNSRSVHSIPLWSVPCCLDLYCSLFYCAFSSSCYSSNWRTIQPRQPLQRLPYYVWVCRYDRTVGTDHLIS